MGQKIDNSGYDPRTFGEEIFEHREVLLRIAFRRSRDWDMAEDLVQETFCRALANAQHFERGTHLRAWLITILKNLHLNQIRKAKRETVGLENVDASAPPVPASQPAHMDLLDAGRALQLLSDQHREIVEKAVHADSYEQMSNACNCKVGTVKSRLSRGRAALMELLSDNTRLPRHEIGSQNVARLQPANQNARTKRPMAA